MNLFDDLFGQAQVDEKEQWTQEQDEILIENFQQFSSLDKKTRFTFLAELVQTKTPKECYLRAKLLKLKDNTLDEAKLISARLISN